jgi:hypothetical protein
MPSKDPITVMIKTTAEEKIRIKKRVQRQRQECHTTMQVLHMDMAYQAYEIILMTFGSSPISTNMQT